MIWDDLLNYIYHHGPTWLALAEGKTNYEICASATNVAESFWSSHETHREQCEALVSRKFEAFQITIGILFFVVFMYKCVSICLFRFVIVRSIARELARELRATVSTTTTAPQVAETMN